MADANPPAKLSLSEVLHRVFDMLGLHADTLKNVHQLIDDHVASPEEVAQRTANPWAGKPDQAVIEAAIAGDQAAAEEYRGRKQAQAQAATDPAPGA